MTILIGKYSGFCTGVKYTVEKAKEILNSNDKVYCLGELVHNEEVVKNLEDKGMVTVNSIEDIPDNSKVIFRAHGEALEVYEKAKNKNLEIYDLTCGKIKIIHKQINDVLDKFIIVVGKKNHPEVIGTVGFTDNAYVINDIDDIDDIDDCYQEYLKSNKNGIYIISQTTYSSAKFDEIVNIIRNKFSGDIIVNKSICDATEKRQKEVLELSKKVDAMIIIGGKNSSNTKELYNLATKYCHNVYLYQTYKDIENKFSDSDTVGIMAGASTPDNVVEKIIEYIKSE